MRGSPPFQVVSKLKLVKRKLSKWNKEVFGIIQHNIKNKLEEISQLHSRNSLGSYDLSIQLKISELEILYDREEKLWKEKCKENNLRFGDRNTSYFHSCTLNRRRKNKIHSLTDHFENISVDSESGDSAPITALFFPSISPEENIALTAIPSGLEILKVVRSMAGDKSPGPDGFNLKIFQHQWPIIGQDITRMVQNFFSTRHILKEMNTTFLALIPKVDHPSMPSDFRPISQCNSTYKIISKNLANRLRPLLGRIISPFQSAFLSNRRITDNIVIAQEVIHTINKTKAKKKQALWV